VGGGIVVVQEPKPTVPLFWALSSQVLTHSFQHIQVKLLIYCCSGGKNFLITSIPSTSKIEISIVFALERNCRALFGLGEFGDFH